MVEIAFKYRPEIDGLRAIAVISVILFHGGLPGFSGGFVGVDVFFVISGYLITGILLRELEAGDFSIARFYERRMRRILPALFAVLMVCVPFAWFLMGPYTFGQFGQGLMAVPAFVSNILFWRTTNYFNATQENPLLHTWSLGVEEQFYIFFPLFLLLVWRYARRWLWASIILAAAISLGLSLWSLNSGRYLAAFYLSPMRAYEMLIGSVVALALWHQGGRLIGNERLASPLAWIGLLLILGSITVYDQASPFPGWLALVPTIGTALILAYTRKDSSIARLLSIRVMVGIGLISYSAYLWHQPVFVFTHLMGWQPGIGGNLFLTVLSLGLAALSWRFIEQPFRDKAYLSRKAVYGLSLVASCIVMALGSWIYLTDGVPQRFSQEEAAWWSYEDIPRQSAYVIRRFRELDGPFDPSTAPRVLVLGDSYAQDFVNMMYEAGQAQNVQIRTVYIPVICQMAYVPEDTTEFISPIDKPSCAKLPTLQSSRNLIEQADVIVLAASWRKWSASRLPETIANMALRADQRLLVIGSKSFGPVNVRQLIQTGRAARLAERRTVGDSVSEVNALMGEALPKEVFIDQIRAVCGPGGQCPLVTPDDKLISYDGGHLTQDGAKYIGERIFSMRPLMEPQ